MEITKDPETGQTITVSRVLLPALKREQHGQELSCEVDSTQVENSITVTYFPLLKVVHPGAQLPLWVKAMLNIGCKSTTTATTHKILNLCSSFSSILHLYVSLFTSLTQYVRKLHKLTQRLMLDRVRTGACVLAGTKAPKLLLLSLIWRAPSS